MAGPVLEFWYDFASTYSYIAAMRIVDMCRRAGVRVEWRPFLLGPVFQRQNWNTSPFNVYPDKGHYMWRDMERLAAKYQLPWHRPSEFPRDSLLAARVGLLAHDQGLSAEYSQAVFQANFVRDQNIASRSVIGTILGKFDRSLHDILAQADHPEIKHRLHNQNETAMAVGIFGAPSFVVDGELFWGQDRLRDAIAYARAGSNENALRLSGQKRRSPFRFFSRS